MNVIAIIPARGGSKGFPGKNIAPLLGVPLIEHTIRHARASKYVNLIVVSTDDERIAQASWKAGASVVNRPPQLAGDYEQPESALIHVLDFWEETYGEIFDLLVFLQCTHPIRRVGDIDTAIEKCLKDEMSSVWSATETDQYVIFDGYGEFYFNHDRARRQDRIPAMLESGNLYVMRPNDLRKKNNRMCGIMNRFYVMPWWCGIEIDEEEDIETCELIMRWKQSELAWMPEGKF